MNSKNEIELGKLDAASAACRNALGLIRDVPASLSDLEFSVLIAQRVIKRLNSEFSDYLDSQTVTNINQTAFHVNSAITNCRNSLNDALTLQAFRSQVTGFYQTLRTWYSEVSFNSEWFLEARLNDQTTAVRSLKQMLDRADALLPDVESRLEATAGRVDELMKNYGNQQSSKLSDFFAGDFAKASQQSMEAAKAAIAVLCGIMLVGLIAIWCLIGKLSEESNQYSLVRIVPFVAFFVSVSGVVWVVVKHFLQQAATNQHKATTLKSLQTLLVAFPEVMTLDLVRAVTTTIFMQDSSVLTKSDESDLAKQLMVQFVSKDKVS